MRTRVQIPNTHVNAMKAWQPAYYRLRAQEVEADSQRKLLGYKSQMGEFWVQVRDPTLTYKVEAIKKDTQYQSLDSTPPE